MGLELTPELLTSPMAGLSILAVCLFWLASYFKTRLDQEKADGIIRAKEDKEAGERREKEWQNRFDKQGEACQKETEELRQEIREVHRQYVTVSNEVTYLKGFYEGSKHTLEPIQGVGMLQSDNTLQDHQ
jgi:hypothetical protein